jgi:hypothetical protein
MWLRRENSSRSSANKFLAGWPGDGDLIVDVTSVCEGWDYQQWNKFGSHAGQPGNRDGVQ